MVYKANGGVGDDQINIYRNDAQIFTITNPVTNDGKTFTGWSTAENGVGGTNFGENAEVTGITGNVTLYAQWGKQNTDGSVELPGKDGILAAPNDKDNVIVTPDPNGTLNGPNQPDGSVKVEKAMQRLPDRTRTSRKEEKRKSRCRMAVLSIRMARSSCRTVRLSNRIPNFRMA